VRVSRFLSKVPIFLSQNMVTLYSDVIETEQEKTNSGEINEE
jgi:hypothetical protein